MKEREARKGREKRKEVIGQGCTVSMYIDVDCIRKKVAEMERGR